MTNRVLMIAYHFPPLKGSSGIQRTLKFCQYLPQFGWQPVVLSANERAYPKTSPEQLGDIAPGLEVKRAFALDTARHLSIKGAYPRLLAMPDKWVSWLFGGLASGLLLIRKTKPQILWSTYPIATAHLIGYGLHRLTGLPWVADLRDPMAQDGYPEDPLIWKSYKWIEDKIARHAAAICFTSPGAIDEFTKKHAGLANSGRLCLIENGYDEECFAEAAAIANANKPASAGRQAVLVHSGIVYTSERDPRPFLQALAELKSEGAVTPATLRVVFRAAENDGYLAQLIEAAGVGDIVELAPAIAYVEALAEMLNASGLILLQAANCNYQIPAKLYEYIRAGRPIFALTDAAGDSAGIIRQLPGNTLANIASCEDIKAKLKAFLGRLDAAMETTGAQPSAQRFSRREKSRELAGLLDSITSRREAARP